MAGFVAQSLTILVILVGVAIYQSPLPAIINIFTGRGRTIERLSSFPYKCQRIYHDRLKGCEDLWLSESTRQLFLACSDPLARPHWMPNMGDLDAAGRSTIDAVIAIDVDTVHDKDFKPRVLATPGFSGTHGDGLLHLVGMGGTDDADGSVRLWLVNAKPSVDTVTGALLDNAKVGSNSTIELFHTGSAATELSHVRTYAHPQIATPNKIAPLGGATDDFFFTNEHGTSKTGLGHTLSPYLKTGDVSFCSNDGPTTACHKAAGNLSFPNGLTMGHDGLLYVPSSMLGTIDVYRPSSVPAGDLAHVDQIATGVALDNLATDARGHIYAAAFPDPNKFLAASKDSLRKTAPAAALRISRREDGDGYEVVTVVEDAESEVLPPSTAVVHDVKTGRIFMTGIFSQFISVCDPK